MTRTGFIQMRQARREACLPFSRCKLKRTYLASNGLDGGACGRNREARPTHIHTQHFNVPKVEGQISPTWTIFFSLFFARHLSSIAMRTFFGQERTKNRSLNGTSDHRCSFILDLYARLLFVLRRLSLVEEKKGETTA